MLKLELKDGDLRFNSAFISNIMSILFYYHLYMCLQSR